MLIYILSPDLDVIQSGTGHALLHLHPVFSKLGGGKGQQMVSCSTGDRGLLARGVTVRHVGRESRVLL